MGATPRPAAEVDIDEGLVRSLLRAQHPDLADLPLRPLASGWDNVLYRLGDELTVRLPRRDFGGRVIEHELRWLPVLAPRLPLPVPVPVRRGEPDERYPWSWAVCPWLPGTVAAVDPPRDATATAVTLGAFLRALHRPAPAEAPVSAVRGCPLGDRSTATHERLDQLAGVIDPHDVAELLARWDDVVTTDAWDRPPVWVHGDLHPANLIVDHGALAAVIDWGDLNRGDPATDVAVAWMLLPPEARPVLRGEAGIDEATWRRGYGWALHHGVSCVAASADDPLIAAMGRRTIAAVLADAVP